MDKPKDDVEEDLTKPGLGKAMPQASPMKADSGFISTNSKKSDYADKFKGGFEAYATSGLNNLGDPRAQQYEVANKTINPNSKAVGKTKTAMGNVYDSGKNKGMTRGQVMEKARKFYSKQPDSWKKQWEDKAQGLDIRSSAEKKKLKY